jgi:hypothetical protein
MKKNIALALLAGFLWSCDNASNKIKPEDQRSNDLAEMAGSSKQPEFKFVSEFHDFGQIEDGIKVEHFFEFENTGEAPLIISKAEGSCGCTVPDWPREPIAPGGKGKIRVEFDSTNRKGRQDKQVKLYANTVPNQKVLKITSEVI